MSTPPPRLDDNLPYASRPSSSLATLALILSLIGLIFPPLGLAGLILGIVARSKINAQPHLFAGLKQATNAITCGVLSLGCGLGVAILLPSLGMERRGGHSSTCSANLRGILQSMVVYSSDNNDKYPYISSTPNAPRSTKLGAPAIPPTTPSDGGLMYSMFVLVGNTSVAPKQFTCRSDPAYGPASATPRPSLTYPFYTPTYWTNSSGKNPNLTYSYSFAWPHSSPNELANYWQNTMDAGVPIAADMNPGTQLIPGKSLHNSLNHEGEGQNIAFGDAHAEFVRTPACGEANGPGPDNIYNLHSSSSTAPGTPGTTLDYPSHAGNTQSTFDTWLLPALTNTKTYDRQ